MFAVYPFAAELFRRGGIPKRLIPGTIALGAFTFTMDALPGTPQIQNIIPDPFFGTDHLRRALAGRDRAGFHPGAGLPYLDWRRRRAAAAGEGYGDGPANEPEPATDGRPRRTRSSALLPLLLVGVANTVLTDSPSRGGTATYATVRPGGRRPGRAGHAGVSKVAAIWAVEGALVLGILSVLVLAWRPLRGPVRRGLQARRRRGAAGAHEHRVGVRLRRR